jgi:hypothetical protein
MVSKLLFFSSIFLLVFLAFPDGVFYPLRAGLFLAGAYLALVGTVFFFGEVPRLRRRIVEALALVILFSAFYAFPPLSLSAIPAAFFVLFYPLYLGLRHGVFRDVLHIFLWLALSIVLSTGIYWPLPKTLWAQVVAAAASSLVAHYLLLRIYRQRRRHL